MFISNRIDLNLGMRIIYPTVLPFWNKNRIMAAFSFSILHSKLILNKFICHLTCAIFRKSSAARSIFTHLLINNNHMTHLIDCIYAAIKGLKLSTWSCNNNWPRIRTFLECDASWINLIETHHTSSFTTTNSLILPDESIVKFCSPTRPQTFFPWVCCNALLH